MIDCRKETLKAIDVSLIKNSSLLGWIFFLFFAMEILFWRLPGDRILSLTGLAVALCLLALKKRALSLPAKKWLFPLFFFSALLVLNSLLNGANLLETRWLERFIFLLLILALLQLMTEDRADFFLTLKWPLFIFLFVIIFYALWQYFFTFLPAPHSHSQHASFFSNINMYTQAMVLGLPLIYMIKCHEKTVTSSQRFIYDLLTVLMSSTLILGYCRSSWLALLAFYFMELYSPSINSRKRTFAIVLTSLALFFSLNALNSEPTQALANKNKTASYRLALWHKSYLMALEQPTGVGTDKFTFELQLYNDGPAQGDNLTDLFRSPHNEFLRVLAEEGWTVFFIYALAVLITLLAAAKALLVDRSKSYMPRFFICLFPEMFFQFPSEIWFSIFLIAVFTAFALSQESQSRFFHLKSKIFLITAAFLIFAVYLVREKKIIPYQYSAHYCSVFPDNWPMCRSYFEDHQRDNNRKAASDTVRPVIKRQPTNYIALAYDYSIGVEPRSQIIACLYYNLFYGKRFMHEEDKVICQLEPDRKKFRLILKEFADLR